MKILSFDIETAPMMVYVFGLKDQNIALNQIVTDWRVLAFAAKWHGTKEVIYRDAREAKDEPKLLMDMWKLLDEADIVITQNGKNFDSKKLNARFIFHGMKPPSPYKHLDTYQIVRRVADFTSNKLEYLTDKLCTKYKKLKHKKFPGFSLWKECLAGNPKAWAEMRTYNIHDVLSTEELYEKIQAWDSSINFTPYTGSYACNCGSTSFEARGFVYTANGKYQRFRCHKCGKWSRHHKNLITADVKNSIRRSAGAH